jgi:hypothetical protein
VPSAIAASLSRPVFVPQVQQPTRPVPTEPVAPGFPDVASLTNIEAMLELGENAVAMVRRVVPEKKE